MVENNSNDLRLTQRIQTRLFVEQMAVLIVIETRSVVTVTEPLKLFDRMELSNPWVLKFEVSIIESIRFPCKRVADDSQFDS